MGVLKKARRLAGKAVKVVTKPIAKALDKVVPNELKPFLPYVAAVAPFMLPAGGIASLPFANNPALQRAILSGTIQLGSQLAQEGSEGDFDVLPLALATASGYLSTPGATDTLQTTQQAAGAKLDALSAAGADIDAISAASETLGAPRSLLTQAKDLGITGLQKAGEFMSAPVREGGPGIFSMAGVKAASVPVTGQTIQDAVNFAKQAEADYLAELAEFNRLAGEEQEASDSARRAAIIASMTRANFTQDIIDETLDQLGLKDGGRVGYQTGGRATLTDFQKALQSVSAGTTYDQQRQARDFARSEANRRLTEAFRSGNQANLQSIFQGVGGIGSLAGLQFNRDRGRIIGAPALGRGRDQIIEAMANQMLSFPTASVGGVDPLQRKIDELDRIVAENERIFREYLDQQALTAGSTSFLPGTGKGPLGTPGITPPEKDQDLINKLTKLTPLQATRFDPFEQLSDIDQYTLSLAYPELMSQRRDTSFTPGSDFVAPMDYQLFQRMYGLKDGGVASFKEGGIMDLGGKEMDMRGGGFIPIGAKERADDVPARLSKNEFVMTADAVRAAGGGSVNKGAKRMYDLMHKLEARA